MSLVVPAVLPSSRDDLVQKLALLTSIPTVSRIQIDVVDGLFASPSSWPYTNDVDAKDPQLTQLPNLDRVGYEIDLMCFNPVKAAEPWVNAGATRLTLHDGSTTDIRELIRSVREHFGHIVSIGVAVHMTTDLELIAESIEHVDYLQCMGIVQVGRQGQPLASEVFTKVRLCRMRYPTLILQVDGGVTLKNGKDLLAAGVSSLVVGSAILRASDPKSAFAAFEALKSPYGV